MTQWRQQHNTVLGQKNSTVQINISAVGGLGDKLVRNYVILLQKNEILWSGSWLKPHSWTGGGIPLSDGDNISFGQQALRRVWKHLIEPKRDEQELWGRVSDYKTVERSGLISFREARGVKSLLEKAVRKGRAIRNPSVAGKGQPTPVEYFTQIFWKKLL